MHSLLQQLEGLFPPRIATPLSEICHSPSTNKKIMLCLRTCWFALCARVLEGPILGSFK